jgi:hypothetical protein
LFDFKKEFDAHLTARLTAYRSFLAGITKSGRDGQVGRLFLFDV